MAESEPCDAAKVNLELDNSMLQSGLYHLHNRAQEEENLKENTTSRPAIAGEERIDVELKSGRRRVGPVLCSFDSCNLA